MLFRSYERWAKIHNLKQAAKTLSVYQQYGFTSPEQLEAAVDTAYQKIDVYKRQLYKLAAGKTAKSILISCGARLAPFDIQELRDLTMYDELQLDTPVSYTHLFLEAMEDTQNAPSLSQAQQLKKMAQQVEFSYEKAFDVMGQEKKSEKRCV